MIRLIIYDLDNTLFDTYGQLSRTVMEDMIESMRAAGLTKKQEAELRERYFYTGFKIIARKAGLSPRVSRIGIENYKNADFSAIKAYKDVGVIRKLREKGIKQALVTSGITEVQQRKVTILGIRGLFDEVIVDESTRIDGKKRVFRDLLCEYGLKPEEAMVVGDNPDSEIASGRELGMVTVQILRRSKMKRGKADHYIKGLRELTRIASKP